jgi:hypothetical protein
VIHRHRWVPGPRLTGAVCRRCGAARRYPTWAYRLFRLRYVDHVGYDDWSLGVTLYRTPARSDLGRGTPQLGVLYGHREAVFELPRWVAGVLPQPPSDL